VFRSTRRGLAAALMLGVPLATSEAGAPAAGATAPPSAPAATTAANDPRLAKLKDEALQMVQARSKQVQEIVDMLFSFQELGFQELESQKYLTGILEKNGFTVTRNVAGMPTAWVATYGSGKPVIALGIERALASPAHVAVAATAVRALIKQFVANENPKKPLSDNQLSDMLKEQGIDCARRTVAKYRESLRIAPTNLRKTL
jgi:hypothetical protein